jgi:hypothetical protein
MMHPEITSRGVFDRIVNFEDWNEFVRNSASFGCYVTNAAFLRQTHRYGSNG